MSGNGRTWATPRERPAPTNAADSARKTGQRRRQEMERTGALLRDYVDESDFSHRAVARRAGMSETELRDVLQEPGSEFLMHELLGILQVLDVSPKSFFARLYGLGSE